MGLYGKSSPLRSIASPLGLILFSFRGYSTGRDEEESRKYGGVKREKAEGNPKVERHPRSVPHYLKLDTISHSHPAGVTGQGRRLLFPPLPIPCWLPWWMEVGIDPQWSPGKRQSQRGPQGWPRTNSPAFTLQIPRESTILLNRIMDFKMPRKAESAVRWAGLLLLTAVFFLELEEEINQTLLSCSTEQVPGKRSLQGSKHIYIINPKLKGDGAWG